MSRITLSVLFALAACAPADVELNPIIVSESEPCFVDEDGDGFYYPTSADCHTESLYLDCDDTDASLHGENCFQGNSDLIPESCFDSVSWMIMAIDTNGDRRNDLLPDREVVVKDGEMFSIYTVHHGWAEVPPMDEVKFMTSSLSNALLSRMGAVWLYGADGVPLGTLVSRQDPPWVAWECPDPP